MSEPFVHAPVLVDRVVALLATVPSGTVVDATLGGGGHSEAILRSRDDLRILGIDRDRSALEAAGERLAHYSDRIELVHGRFDALTDIIEDTIALKSSPAPTTTHTNHPGSSVVGVLFDLGVSSPQLDRSGRGFSYRNDGPLDMRMDTSGGVTAADIVNETTAGELSALLRANSDERHSDRIARAIVAARPIENTTHLAEVIRDAIPAPARRTGGHPAKRSFQAIRIAVNGELDILPAAMDAAIDATADGGKVLTISYHSGEDRIVKDRYRNAISGGCTCPQGLPCVCGAVSKATAMKAEVPADDEIEGNPRARSARLRVLEVARG